jgi:hypothetical protein
VQAAKLQYDKTCRVEGFVRQIAPKYGHLVKSRKLTLPFLSCFRPIPMSVPLRSPNPVVYRVNFESDSLHNARVCLLQTLLGHMPNLVEVAMDHDYEGIHHVFKDLASHRGLRSLSLVGYSRGRGLDPALLSELLINLPELVSLRLVRVQNLPSKLGEILASMPKLKTLNFDFVNCMDKSWMIPYASGGLSSLRLWCCRYIDTVDLEEILAVHADSLEKLDLHHIFVLDETRKLELGRGPLYKLNRLKTLIMTSMFLSEGYLKRFSQCPIKFLKVTLLLSRPTRRD